MEKLKEERQDVVKGMCKTNIEVVLSGCRLGEGPDPNQETLEVDGSHGGASEGEQEVDLIGGRCLRQVESVKG